MGPHRSCEDLVEGKLRTFIKVMTLFHKSFDIFVQELQFKQSSEGRNFSGYFNRSGDFYFILPCLHSRSPHHDVGRVPSDLPSPFQSEEPNLWHCIMLVPDKKNLAQIWDATLAGAVHVNLP